MKTQAAIETLTTAAIRRIRREATIYCNTYPGMASASIYRGAMSARQVTYECFRALDDRGVRP